MTDDECRVMLGAMAQFEAYALEHERKRVLAAQEGTTDDVIRAATKRDTNLRWAERIRYLLGDVK